jgi:hypothetical protein
MSTRFDSTIISPLVTLLKKEGHNWNPDTEVPTEAPFQVVEIGGIKLRKYEEPTVAEFGVKSLIDAQRQQLFAEYESLKLNKASTLVNGQYAEAFEGGLSQAMAFLTGDMDALTIVSAKNPETIAQLSPIRLEMLAGIQALIAEVNSLADLCLCYFLSSRTTVENKPWTVDTLASIGTRTRRKLEEYMESEINPVEDTEPTEGKDETPAPKTPES